MALKKAFAKVSRPRKPEQIPRSVSQPATRPPSVLAGAFWRARSGGDTLANFVVFVRPLIALLLSISVITEGFAQERRQIHSFEFRNIELHAALDSLLRWYAVPLIYLDNDVAGKRVNAQCNDCGFENALNVVIETQGLTWKKLGEQILLQREAEAKLFAATFAGTIRDSLTGEAVIGADVLLLSQSDLNDTGADPPRAVYRWGSTNQFGFFSLRNIRPGNYALEIRRLGYHTKQERVNIPSGTAIVRDFSMLEQTLTHPEITVEGRRSAFSVAEGISRGVYIRATPTDHNQYLLEGARIYNPLHFGGVMSTFNGDAMRDVQVIAGGVPPFYGGRIGGILDVALRDGSEQRLAGSVEVGSFGSNLMLEGPVLSATTFVLSARGGYPDFLLPAYRTDETPSDLNSFELMGKLTYHLRDQRVSASGYFTRDAYGKHVTDGGTNLLANSLRWGNAAANLRWVGVMSPALFSYASAGYTRYGFDVQHRLEGNAAERFTSNYFIEDIALRAHAEYFYDELHTLLAGAELVRHRISGTISEFTSQIAPMSFADFSPWELAVYMQDQWRLTPSVLAEMGARATSFVAKQGSFSAVDPRFSLLVSLRDDLRMHSSLSSVTQFVHPYRQSGIFLFYPSIFLYPSTNSIQPSTSLQISLGMEKTLSEDRYRLAMESYYRITQNLHEFIYDSTMVTSLSDALLTGEGNVYGVEVTFDKRFGDMIGSVRYGLSWTKNRFAELNGGEWFTPRFDRRHELYVTLSYSPRENWSLGFMALLSANRFPSVPSELFRTESSAASDQASPFGPAVGTPRTTAGDIGYAEPYDLNGGRLPGFQRLELRVQRRSTWWGTPVQTTLRLLNGYGLVDPFVWSLRQNPDNRLRWGVKLDAPSFFPLYPVVGVNIRF